ncbi:hypothetical protein BSKO_03596 [Bryopsis sp. KO-2023]|nr:hypothetical protein BSKO_03596 [Bryopsis sp. KO-2023]
MSKSVLSVRDLHWTVDVNATEAVSLDHLLQEVAICSNMNSYAIRRGVDFVALKRLWDSPVIFVRSVLRAHKVRGEFLA